jgi:23S rRNA G2445 N2-methylase RlmL
MIVTNPPYGERLPTERDFYRELGQALRKLHGHRVGILLTQRRHERELGLKPERFRILYNGDLECRLMVYDIR